MKLTDESVTIDDRKVESLAQHALTLHPGPRFAQKVCPPLEDVVDEDAFRAFFWAATICHSTKGGLVGSFGSARCQGWDYLLRAFGEASRLSPECVSPASVGSIDATGLRSLLERFATEPQVTLADIPRRAEMLRVAAQELGRLYDARLCSLLHRCSHRVGGTDGAYSRLRSFSGFKDPLEKKSTAFLMTVHYSGRWRILDHENVRPMMDYHRLRLLLRLGVIVIKDAALHERLACGTEVACEEAGAIRELAESAFVEVVRRAGVPMFDFDVLLWAHARSCCRHHPVCQGGDLESDSFYDYLEVPFEGSCVFEQWCRGRADAHVRALWEPVVPTENY